MKLMYSLFGDLAVLVRVQEEQRLFDFVLGNAELGFRLVASSGGR